MNNLNIRNETNKNTFRKNSDLNFSLSNTQTTIRTVPHRLNAPSIRENKKRSKGYRRYH